MKKIFMILVVLLLLTSCKKVESYEILLGEGYDTINQNEIWVDGGCMITINEEQYNMELNAFPDTEIIGEHTLTYTYTYGRQQFACQRVVKVLDNSFPQVELLPGIDTIYVGEQHIDQGIVVTDDQQEECTVVISNNIDFSQVGNYSITYLVTDHDGNQTTIIRVVNVITRF